MTKYCVDCKFAAKSSGNEIWCGHHGVWMNKYGTCNDWLWKNARSYFMHKLVLLLFSNGK